jgi:hypothetical protein
MLLVLLALVAHVAHSASAFTGDLTAYAGALDGPGGAAGYACGIVDVPYSHAQTYFVAMNDQQYANGAACGRCVRATGPTGVPVLMYVVDRCGECQFGALDTSIPAYSLLTGEPPGRLSSTWDWAPCDFVTGNVRVSQQTGSSQWWMGLQVLDSITPVDSVEIGGVQLVRAAYGFWHPPGVPPTDRTCVIRSGSQTITFALNDYGSAGVQDTGQQFEAGGTPTEAPSETPTRVPSEAPTPSTKPPRTRHPRTKVPRTIEPTRCANDSHVRRG